MTTTQQELADLEAQINQKNEELKAQAPAPKPDNPVESQAKSENVSSESKSEAATNAGSDASSSEKSEESFDPKTYVEKKGWKSAEDAAQSYRELEKKWHAKNQEKQAAPQTPPAPYMPPQNPYIPNQGFGYQPQPPAYAPQPQFPVGMNEDQIAQSYGVTVDDLRRVVPLMRDIAQIERTKLQNEIESWRGQMTREQEKQSDFQALIADPAFRSPEVQLEIDSILTKNPDVFNERRPYTAALNQAIVNIGRNKILKGASDNSNPSPTSTPPVTAGASHANGTAPRGKVPSGLPSREQFENMNREEQEKVLKRMDAFKTWKDYL